MAESLDSRARAVFNQAIDLQGPLREALLATACGGDEQLRSRVVRLLAAAEAKDQFLSGGQDLSAPPELEVLGPGSRIAGYRLVEQIGEGGFGIVFRAQQEQPVRREVALKIIREGMDTRAVIARFEQERQALAIMNHPGIAKVYDAGATASGRPYFVMELVEGEPITAYCDRASLSIPERLQLLAQVCRAVQHAHTKGIIHRDIKPSNVLVSASEGGQGEETRLPQCKIIDFGIAKAIQRPLTEKTLFTEARQFIGTPEYMSPEQAAGSADIDTRTDVYSLGVLAYELLAGVTPFDPGRLRSAAYNELQRIIQEVDPPTPSTRLSHQRELIASVAAHRRVEPQRLNTMLRGELDWIVMRALDKDRSRRYDSPGNLAADIERYLAGQPVEAAPPSIAYRSRKFMRRHRGPVVAAALVLATLVLGLVSTGVALSRLRSAQARIVQEAAAARDNADRASAEAARADREAAAARQQACMAESANALMTTLVQKANRAREQGRADITVREVMDVAAKDLESGGAQAEPAVELILARTIGDTYRELGLLDPAEKMLRRASELAQQVHGATSAEYGEALSSLGGLLKIKGQPATAAELYSRAREILTAAGDNGAFRLAGLRINIAALIADEGRLEEAERELRDSIAYFEAHPEHAGQEYFTALHNLAAVSYQKGDIPASLATLRRAVELETKAFGPEDPRLIESLNGLSVLQVASGDLTGAEMTMRQQLAAARRLRGDSHMQVAHILETLGTILVRRGDYTSAAEVYREALDISRSVVGAAHLDTGRRAGNLAGALIELAKFDEAETQIRAALAIYTGSSDLAAAARSSPARPDLMIAWYRLGLLLERRGEWSEAEAILRPALEAAAAAVPDGERYEWMRRALASLLGQVLSRSAAAETAVEKRLALLREIETLVVASAERLLEIETTMGPQMRKLILPAAIQRAVQFCTLANQMDPSEARAAALELWRQRQAALTDVQPSR